MTSQPKIIFFGTPEFGAIILEMLAQSEFTPLESRYDNFYHEPSHLKTRKANFLTGFKPIAVITEPDKPAGRKRILIHSPVKKIALKYDIPVLQPARQNFSAKNLSGQENINNQEFIGKIKKLKPDLFIVAAYGKILPKEILDIPKFGSLNLHPSLLPKYRGASPIQATILAGDKITGLTIILMDEKIDHGPILAQRELEILNSKFEILNKPQISKSKITYKELSEKLAELGGQLLIKTIPKWLTDKIKSVPQDHTKATFTKRIKKQDGLIDWTKPADEIEKMTRAYCPWPGAFTTFKIKSHRARHRLWRSQRRAGISPRPTSPLAKSKAGGNLKSLKIIKARPNCEEILAGKPGQVFLIENKKIAVVCGKNVLIIEKLQLEGKRIMTAQEFLNGHPEIIGSILK